MAEAKGNTAVPHEGDHDRVVMLSLNADGSPAQHNPEIIGDKAFAEAAAKRQFAEQAVSARDVQLRGVSAGAVTIVGTPEGQADKEVPATVGEDPTVAKLAEAHESAQKAGEASAEKAVGALFKD
ncbi:MAG: hypothetical protein HOV83_22125 [Catenulispora sp.]|nr:hypothetical protein [Catenulispora sp.]